MNSQGNNQNLCHRITHSHRVMFTFRVSVHHHNHHVHEGLGVFPVPSSSRCIWSLHLFLGRPTFLRPFGLYCSACFGILFVSLNQIFFWRFWDHVQSYGNINWDVSGTTYLVEGEVGQVRQVVEEESCFSGKSNDIRKLF